MKTKTLQRDKVNIITLGCSKNMVDSEVLSGQLIANDIDTVHESGKKDHNIVIVNTCGFIEKAKEDFRKALKPTVEENVIKELGYSLVTTDTFSFARDRYFVNNVTEEWVQDFIERYDGFVQIYQVEQFDCPFQIWVSNENLSKAQAEVEHEFS
jgi:hypothetical protein